MAFFLDPDPVAFFHAVLGLSMDPKDPKEESESVSMMARVRSPILEILLIEDLRSSKIEPPLSLYMELQE